MSALTSLLDRLGPFEPRPRLAIGASGGADSTALALIATEWARARGGNVLALIVDHGLRDASASEAALTRGRLAERGIEGRILTLALRAGPGLAARARAARYEALIWACRDAGIVHLLLGHHAGDQAETYLMRARAGSGIDGLASIQAVTERHDIRILRPLLSANPAALRRYLRDHGMSWIEDPTNQDLRTTRARLRAELATRDAAPELRAAADAAAARAGAAERQAAILAERVHFSPLGFAVLTPGPIESGALAAIVRTIGGRIYPAPGAAVARIAASPAPATLAGVRLLVAGRLGPGWLLVREHVAPPLAAVPGAVWDRFVLLADPPVGCTIAALGASAHLAMPAVVRRVLPALWRDGALIAGPEAFRFLPPVPASM